MFALPFVYSYLGWVLGITLLLLVAAIFYYTTFLLWRCQEVCPGVRSYVDLAMAVSRSTFFIRVVTGFLCASLVVLMSNFLNVMAEGFRMVFFPVDAMCVDYWLWVSAPLAVLSLQWVRKIDHLRIAAVVKFLALNVLVLVVLINIFSNGGPIAETSVGMRVPVGQGSKGQLLLISEGINVMMFAFGIQLVVLELSPLVPNRAQLPRSLTWAYPYLFMLYFLVAAAGYLHFGYNFEDANVVTLPYNLLGELPQNWVRSLAGLLVIIITGVSYLVFGTVLNRVVIIHFWPSSDMYVDRPAYGLWAGVSMLIGFLVALIAAIIPFFQTTITFLGSLTLGISCAALPCIFYMLLSEKIEREVSPWETLLLYGVLCFVILATFLGAVAGGFNMYYIYEIYDYRGPFTCTCTSSLSSGGADTC